MKNQKFVVIGLGHIGKRHAEMIQRQVGAELVATVDIRSREACEIEHLEVPHFTTIEEVIVSGLEFDVANVCTPNGLHAEHCLAVLGAKKAVVCEKPMGLTTQSCEEVIKKSLEVNRQVFCVMQNRYSPPSVWIKGLVDSGKLGKIFQVQVNCYWNRDARYYKAGGWKGTQELDGGTLFTQFSHFIDIMYWLFGDIKNIQATFNDFNHKELTDFEDSGLVHFEFVKGGMGTINYSTAVAEQNLESSLTIIGELGSVKIGGQYMNEVEVCNIPGYEMPELAPTNPGNDYGAYKGSAANHDQIIKNVVQTLNGETSPTTNVFEGLKVVQIIENIYKLRPEHLIK